MKTFKNIFLFLALTFACLVLPKAALAASLSFSVGSQTIHSGDVFEVQLNLDTQKQKINVLDSSIYFDANLLQVDDISTGGSIFNFWTRQPIYNNQAGKIVFTGGTSQSFSGSSGNVLTIVFSAKDSGQAPISLGVDSAVFLADGKGTKLSPHLNNQLVSISESPQNYSPVNQWDNVLAEDKTPPHNLNITLGKDPAIFGGKYFISFSAVDDGSGINYYAVKEGAGDFVQTESPYVLNDQSLSGVITVKAVDKAGNFVTANLALNQGWFASHYKFWIIIALVIVLINLIWATAFLKIKKNTKI